MVSPNARYAQYRVTLTTSDSSVTPVVERVELTAVSLPPNRPPTASDQAVSTAEDIATAITLGGTDPDGDPLTYTVGTPAHGALSGVAPT